MSATRSRELVNRLREITSNSWIVPLALFVLCAFSFGLLIPWLGFYWDDWPAMWFLHFLEPAGFKDVFAADRPMLGLLFRITTSLFGESALSWQIFGFLARWLCSVALWWILRLVWPSRPIFAAWVAMLFAVYPGFSQQFIAVTYSHVFVILLIFMLSIISMILALRNRRWFWPLYLFSVLSSAFSMFSVEYFFGLELLRPIILWFELRGTAPVYRVRIRMVAMYWAPYFAIMVAFLVWVIFIHETPRGQIQIFDTVAANTFPGVLQLIQIILSDMVEAGLVAWGRFLTLLNLETAKQIGPLIASISVLITLLAAALIILFLWLFHGIFHQVDETSSETTTVQKRRFPFYIMLLGVFALFIAGWPFWTTRHSIALKFPLDRFTLPMMVGSSLFIAGLFLLIKKHKRISAIILGLLLSLAIGYQFVNANQFRWEWKIQRSFFWQLAWRAPGLEPGTLILSSELPFTYYSDNSLTAPLNWTYSPEELPAKMPYLLYQIEARLGSALPSFNKGEKIEEDYRTTIFTGSTDQVLVLYYEPPGCVQVLDPEVHARMPQKPKFISDSMPLSDPNLIIVDAVPPAQPPLHILGPEPEPEWCYYFEKADLARQSGLWEQVVELGQQAFLFEESLERVNAREYLPYIEGYARTGDLTRAKQLTFASLELNGRMNKILCTTWDRLISTSTPSAELVGTVREIRNALKCDQIL